MSTEIDRRVVEMRFDNAQFEKNIKQSLKTLQDLKKNSDMTEVVKGISSIEKSLNNFSLKNISAAVTNGVKEFGLLGVAGFTAFQRITNAAIDAALYIANTVGELQALRAGFSEYETQINAVQTILSNTASKGTTIDDVNRALDELNEYADKTIYNFTQMTNNIGKFTAAGVGLEDSVAAIKGISNLAAVSGSDAAQASRAMYNLSQALAMGKLQVMDWNSVVNAGMGGEIFQESLKETARVHGVAVDEIIAKEGSFRDSLSQGWITAEILTETLQKFTGDLSEEQLRSLGYTEEQIVAITELGDRANKAATQVKTFTQLFDTLNEARQSGWTQTWEIIIGDFYEARELLTNISDLFSDLINEGATKRNSFLESVFGKNNTVTLEHWNDYKTKIEASGQSVNDFTRKLLQAAKQNGVAVDEMMLKWGNFENSLRTGWLTEDLWNKLLGIENSSQAVGNIANQTKETIQSVVDEIWSGQWGNGEERWSALAEAGYDPVLIQSLVDLSEATENNQIDWENLTEEQLRSVGASDEQIEAFRALNSELGTTSDLTGVDGGMEFDQQMSGREAMIEGLMNILHTAIDIFRVVGEAWEQAFPMASADSIRNLLYNFKDFTETLKLNDEQLEKLRTGLRGIFDVLGIVFDALGVGFEIVKGIIGIFKDENSESTFNFLDEFAKIGAKLSGLRNSLKDGEKIKAFVDSVVGKVKEFVEWAGEFKQQLVNLFTGGEFDPAVFEKVKNVFDNLKKSVRGLKFDGVVNKLKQLRTFLSDKNFKVGFLDNIITKLDGKSVGEVFDNVKSNIKEKLESFSIGEFKPFEAVSTAFEKFKTWIGELSIDFSPFDAVKNTIETVKSWFIKDENETEGSSIFDRVRTAISEFPSDLGPLSDVKSAISEIKSDLFPEGDGSTIFDKIKSGFETFTKWVSSVLPGDVDIITGFTESIDSIKKWLFPEKDEESSKAMALAKSTSDDGPLGFLIELKSGLEDLTSSSGFTTMMSFLDKLPALVMAIVSGIALQKFKELTSGLGDAIQDLIKSIRGDKDDSGLDPSIKFVAIAAGIGILAASLVELSQVNTEGVGTALVGLAAGITALILAFALATVIGGRKSGFGIFQALALLPLSMAIKTMAGIVKDLAEIDITPQEALTASLVIAAMGGLLVGLNTLQGHLMTFTGAATAFLGAVDANILSDSIGKMVGLVIQIKESGITVQESQHAALVITELGGLTVAMNLLNSMTNIKSFIGAVSGEPIADSIGKLVDCVIKIKESKITEDEANLACTIIGILGAITTAMNLFDSLSNFKSFVGAVSGVVLSDEINRLVDCVVKIKEAQITEDEANLACTIIGILGAITTAMNLFDSLTNFKSFIGAVSDVVLADGIGKLVDCVIKIKEAQITEDEANVAYTIIGVLGGITTAMNLFNSLTNFKTFVGAVADQPVATAIGKLVDCVVDIKTAGITEDEAKIATAVIGELALITEAMVAFSTFSKDVGWVPILSELVVAAAIKPLVDCVIGIKGTGITFEESQTAVAIIGELGAIATGFTWAAQFVNLKSAIASIGEMVVATAIKTMVDSVIEIKESKITKEEADLAVGIVGALELIATGLSFVTGFSSLKTSINAVAHILIAKAIKTMVDGVVKIKESNITKEEADLAVDIVGALGLIATGMSFASGLISLKSSINAIGEMMIAEAISKLVGAVVTIKESGITPDEAVEAEAIIGTLGLIATGLQALSGLTGFGGLIGSGALLLTMEGLSAFVEAVAKLAQVDAQKMSDNLDTMAEGFERNATKMGSAAAQFSGGFVEEIGAAMGKAVQEIGKAIVKGLVEGIMGNELLQGLYNGFAQLVNQLANGLGFTDFHIPLASELSIDAEGNVVVNIDNANTTAELAAGERVKGTLTGPMTVDLSEEGSIIAKLPDEEEWTEITRQQLTDLVQRWDVDVVNLEGEHLELPVTFNTPVELLAPTADPELDLNMAITDWLNKQYGGPKITVEEPVEAEVPAEPEPVVEEEVWTQFGNMVVNKIKGDKEFGKTTIDGKDYVVTVSGGNIVLEDYSIALSTKYQVSKGFENLGNVEIKLAGTEVANSFDEGFGKADTETAKKFGQDAGNSVVNGTKNVLEIASPSQVAEGIGANWNEGLGIGIDQSKNIPISAVVTVGDQMASKLSSLWHQFYDAASYCVQGLSEGFKNGSYTAVEAARQTALDALNAAKQTLGVASPSKEFAKIGMYSDQGLAQGFIKYIPDIVHAVNETGQTAIDTLYNAMVSPVNDLYDDFDLYPNITPIVDLHNIQNANQLLSRSFGITTSDLMEESRALKSQFDNSLYYEAYDDSGVIGAIMGLNDRLNQLDSSISNMSMVLDSGALVGQLTPRVDKQLGTIARRKARGV